MTIEIHYCPACKFKHRLEHTVKHHKRVTHDIAGVVPAFDKERVLATYLIHYEEIIIDRSRLENEPLKDDDDMAQLAEYTAAGKATVDAIRELLL